MRSTWEEKMEPDLARKLRHDMRGRWHAISLCMSALELTTDAREKVEMLDMLTRSAEELDQVVEQMMALPEDAGR
jgi:hypothetical protein